MAAKIEGVRELEFKSWEEVRVVGIPPCTRYSHSVVLYDDVVYVFGGGSSREDGTTTYHGDLFSLNLSVLPPEWKSIEQKGAVPSPREGAHFIATDDKLYLFGGIDEEGSTTCAEGLFVFTPASAVWERLETTGSAPSAQSSSAVLYDKKLITLGGIINGVAQNCLHFLNLDTLEWTAVEATGSLPPQRCDHSAFMMGEKMMLTAGSGSDELWFNDVHALDIGSWKWTKVNPDGTVLPSPRDYASVNVITEKYAVMFGGFSGTSGGEECFAELYYVDFSERNFKWQSVTAPTEPSISERYAHSAFFYKNKLYVFGGQNLEEEFNDIWSIAVQVPPVVTFDPTPVPRVCYTTSTPIPAPRKVITPLQPATPKPRDLDEIRTNYVKKINELFDTLSERFQQLDMANATLESERAAFESEKKAYGDLYEKQQAELEEMLKSHQQQNDEWIGRMRDELNEERRVLAVEKAAIEAGNAELAGQQETFQQKSKKLDAIMRQVQGLKD